MTSDSKDFLGKIVNVVIDRPLGSKHPEFDYLYPLNYGYIPETLNADGEEIDAYVLGVNRPIKKFKGKVLAIIEREEDKDDKLVVVSKEANFSDKDIERMMNFQEKWFEHKIIRKR